MNLESILKWVGHSEYFVEFEVKYEEGDYYIIGHVSSIKNPSGFGRREFVFRDKDEQEVFLMNYLEVVKREKV